MANVCVFCGRATADPKVTYTQGDNPMCIARFGLAVDRRGKDKGVDYPNMVAFGKTGEFVEKYIKKGTKVVVRSRYQSGSYTNRDNQKVYTHEFAIDEIEFAESKAASAQNQNSQPQNASAQAAPAQKQSVDEYLNVPDMPDSELPFA